MVFALAGDSTMTSDLDNAFTVLTILKLTWMHGQRKVTPVPDAVFGSWYSVLGQARAALEFPSI